MKVLQTISVRARAGVRQAFTLVEVMVAVCIIVIGVVSVFYSMNLAFTMTESTRENLRATQIMLDKLEGVRLYTWNQVNNTNFLIPGFTNYFYETNNVGEWNATGSGVMYTGSVQVTNVPFSTVYTPNMVQVNVNLNWTSTGSGWYGGGIVHTRTMSTYVALNGMQNYIYNSY